MTPAKKSEILRFARKRIAGYKSDYLCCAINKVRVGTIEQKNVLLRWITALLDSTLSYSAWLRKHHPEAYSKMFHMRGAVRQGRLAWIDWMIAECEKEEANGQLSS